MNQEIPLVKSYLNDQLSSFKKFMGIEKMPIYELGVNEANKANQNGITVFASHNYNVKTDKHTLTVSKDICNGDKDYILFHEFTHMYDVITFSAKNPDVYFANRGFTEYHAAQIELLKLLGANSIDDKISFSLTQSIETILGKTTILEYVLHSRNGAREQISKVNFPDNLNTFSSVLGMIFNHLGRVSICRLYASDFETFRDELEDMEFEASFLGNNFRGITSIARGFLNNTDKANFGILYFPIAYELMIKYEKNFQS